MYDYSNHKLLNWYWIDSDVLDDHRSGVEVLPWCRYAAGIEPGLWSVRVAGRPPVLVQTSPAPPTTRSECARRNSSDRSGPPSFSAPTLQKERANQLTCKPLQLKTLKIDRTRIFVCVLPATGIGSSWRIQRLSHTWTSTMAQTSRMK